MALTPPSSSSLNRGALQKAALIGVVSFAIFAALTFSSKPNPEENVNTGATLPRPHEVETVTAHHGEVNAVRNIPPIIQSKMADGDIDTDKRFADAVVRADAYARKNMPVSLDRTENSTPHVAFADAVKSATEVASRQATASTASSDVELQTPDKLFFDAVKNAQLPAN